MNKYHALILSIIITLLIACNVYILSIVQQPTLTAFTIIEIKDGDTIVTDKQEVLRLANINAPEKNFFNSNQSYFFLKQYENKTIFMQPIEKDRYQRTVARIFSSNKKYLNLELVKLGLSSKFLVQDSETSDFAKAEQNAISQSLGIWQHSDYYGCLSAEIDKYNEFLIITNNCHYLLKDLIIKDESRKTLKISELLPGKTHISSFIGENNKTTIFFNSKTNIWNNDRDTLYVFDKNGFIVYSLSYGY